MCDAHRQQNDGRGRPKHVVAKFLKV
jgi:hypothetical protein